MKKSKTKKKNYNKRTVNIMRILFILSLLSVIGVIIAMIFDEPLKNIEVMDAMLSLYIFSFGLYFAKQNKKSAGIIGLVYGLFRVISLLIIGKVFSLGFIVGAVVLIDSIFYLKNFKKK